MIFGRLYAEFLLPSRLDVYGDFLRRAMGAGYSTHSVIGFWRLLERSGFLPEGKHLLLRHDVDQSPTMARRMWELEVSLGAVSSFYFRLETLDVRLMRQIAESGREASYHYEEMATVAKRMGLATAEELRRHIPEMQEAFRGNLGRLRELTGLPMESVASHGDFVNRRLGVSNHAILSDQQFRRQTGVVLEAYDQEMRCHVESLLRDDRWPGLWHPCDPTAALAEGKRVVHLLTHPCHWGSAAGDNVKAYMYRIRDELWYKINRARRRRGGLRRTGRDRRP